MSSVFSVGVREQSESLHRVVEHSRNIQIQTFFVGSRAVNSHVEANKGTVKFQISAQQSEEKYDLQLTQKPKRPVHIPASDKRPQKLIRYLLRRVWLARIPSAPII